MAYTVGQSGVANYANTTLTTVSRIVAVGGMGAASEVAVGGSSRVSLPFILSTSTPFPETDISSLTGYIAGKTDVTYTVNSNVYIAGTIAAIDGNPAMYIRGGTTGDTVKIINNGYIVGYGANAGIGSNTCFVQSPQNGSPAIQTLLYCPLTVVNNAGAFIAGGGGGGGGGGSYADGCDIYFVGGGGGAGGGLGYGDHSPPSFGSSGVNGNILIVNVGCGNYYFVTGGDGGYNFTSPITGGALGTLGSATDYGGIGGKAGGSGAVSSITRSSLIGNTVDNNGGSTGNAPNVNNTIFAITAQGGGGGGFGGAGSYGIYNGSQSQLGGVGGNAIKNIGSGTLITSGTGTTIGAVGA
jgi:hypothetical protein